MMLLALLIAGAALQPAQADARNPPVPREAHVFDDWVGACDNGLRCQAVGVHSEGGEPAANGVMVVERGSEAEAPLTVRLAQVDGTPARLMVYGEALPVRLVAAGGDFLVEIADRSVFLERILYADQIDMEDANGAAIGGLSLKGLRHVLLYFDEAQGRLHTSSALIRTGRRAATEVPPAPPIPAIRIAPATREAPLAISRARIAQLRRQARCTIGDVGGPDDYGVHALGAGKSLLLLACGSGAYNVTIVPFLAEREGRGIRIEPAPFDLPLDQSEDEEGHRILINGAWDEQARSITDFSQGRGMGDCGSRSSYGWDGDRFRLVSREVMPECRGSSVFVTTWRAELVQP